MAYLSSAHLLGTDLQRRISGTFTDRSLSEKHAWLTPARQCFLQKIIIVSNRLIVKNYSPRSLPQKNRATVPGPVWLPMVVPTLFIKTLPFSLGNRSSTIAATA